MIESYLSLIGNDYFLSTEYKRWRDNLDNECKANGVCWQEYCWQAIHEDEYMFLARSKKDAICYLLQDPEGNVLCDRYERYIEMCLHKALNESEPCKQAEILKGLHKNDALYLLELSHSNHNNVARVRALVNKLCYSAPDGHKRRKGRGLREFIRGKNDTEIEEELNRMKAEIRDYGLDVNCVEHEAFARWIVKQIKRNDGKGLKSLPTTKALMELSQKKKTATDDIRIQARKFWEADSRSLG